MTDTLTLISKWKCFKCSNLMTTPPSAESLMNQMKFGTSRSSTKSSSGSERDTMLESGRLLCKTIKITQGSSASNPTQTFWFCLQIASWPITCILMTKMKLMLSKKSFWRIIKVLVQSTSHWLIQWSSQELMEKKLKKQTKFNTLCLDS